MAPLYYILALNVPFSRYFLQVQHKDSADYFLIIEFLKHYTLFKTWALYNDDSTCLNSEVAFKLTNLTFVFECLWNNNRCCFFPPTPNRSYPFIAKKDK